MSKCDLETGSHWCGQNPSGDGSRQMPGKTANVKKVPASEGKTRVKAVASGIPSNGKVGTEEVEAILARIRKNHSRVVATMERRYRS